MGKGERRVNEVAEALRKDGHSVEWLPSGNDMLFLWQIGAADFEAWQDSCAFGQIIEKYGTAADQARLHKLRTEPHAALMARRDAWLATQP